jgi:hypothetical protein
VLPQNWQQFLLALPGKQVVLSLQHAWLDVSYLDQLHRHINDGKHSPFLSTTSISSSTFCGVKLLMPNLLNFPAR